ncbi:MAG: hypothetical protein ACM3OB_01945 [Acidobacteriota bacterium]
MRRLLATIACLVLAALAVPWPATGCAMGACPIDTPAGGCALDAPMPCCPSVVQTPPLPAATTTGGVSLTAAPVVSAIVVVPSPSPASAPAPAPVRRDRHGGPRQALLSIFRI